LNSPRPVILAHGGAGRRRPITRPQATCLDQALAAGYAVLQHGGPALVAVERTIRVLEDSGLFNAGRGSNRQLDGVMRMDASIMEGATLKAGAVASIEGIVHPISAARLVMEETSHVLLVGPSATRFAHYFHLKRQSRMTASHAPRRTLPVSAAATQTRRLYRAMIKARIRATDLHGTVGAVALDRSGTVAAGASTGGIEAMLPGRVGDTPLIGCGVYADNRGGAVSMTGIGEGIIRLAMAKTICDCLAVGTSPARAAQQILRQLVARLQGAAGMLVLAPDGRFAIRHVTRYMAAGWWKGTGKPTVQGRFR
jgi:beta-aspartyl-peptidase (threonine type)